MATDHYTATGNYQNLFVAKLPLSVTDAELMSVFSAYGPTNATVMLDPVSGRSKGYAFVLFPTEKAGRDAASALDKTTATVPRPAADNADATFSFDLTLFASKHSGKEVAAENECLYIRNIPNSWPMSKVEGFIAEHGKPVYSAVRSDHLGSPVWVVFVEYDSIESARRTLKAVHGMVVAPRCPPILAKYAENEDVKRNRRDRKLGHKGRHTRQTTEECKNDSHRNHRIDVTHQLHRPCHAVRYDASGHRVASETTVANLPVAVVPAANVSPITSPNIAPSKALDCATLEAGLCNSSHSASNSNPTSSSNFLKSYPQMPRALTACDSFHHLSSCSSGSSISSKQDEPIRASAMSSNEHSPMHDEQHRNSPNHHYRYRHDPYSTSHAPILIHCE